VCEVGASAKAAVANGLAAGDAFDAGAKDPAGVVEFAPNPTPSGSAKRSIQHKNACKSSSASMGISGSIGC